jgi:hypothetical protein
VACPSVKMVADAVIHIPKIKEKEKTFVRKMK